MLTTVPAAMGHARTRTASSRGALASLAGLRGSCWCIIATSLVVSASLQTCTSTPRWRPGLQSPVPRHDRTSLNTCITCLTAWSIIITDHSIDTSFKYSRCALASKSSIRAGLYIEKQITMSLIYISARYRGGRSKFRLQSAECLCNCFEFRLTVHVIKENDHALWLDLIIN